MIVVPPIIGREVVASSGVAPGIDVVTQPHLDLFDCDGSLCKYKM